MANTITNAAVANTLVRSQSANIAGLRSEQQARQAMITQLQNVVNQGKQLTAQASSQSADTPPRGSFVDITV